MLNAHGKQADVYNNCNDIDPNRFEVFLGSDIRRPRMVD